MYNNRARSRSRNRAEVTPTLFPTAFVPLPPKNDKSRMNEAIAKEKVNPYDQSRAVPNTPSQVQPTPPKGSIAQPISNTPRTADPKRDSTQNAAMPVRSGIQATPVNRVQQPHQSRSVQQEIRKPSPSVADNRTGYGNERVRPTTPNRPVHCQQQTKRGQVQQEIPTKIPAPSPSLEVVGTGDGSSSVRLPTPTRPPTTNALNLNNNNTRANGTPRFNWAEKNPDEVLGRAKSTPGEQQRVVQMSDLFLDEPDEPPPMDDFPESTLHTLSIHSDHPHPPNARKRPHNDIDTDEESMLEEDLRETLRTSLFEEQPQLAQEINAHFEEAQAREEMTKKLQETFISFIAKMNEQKRVAKENYP